MLVNELRVPLAKPDIDPKILTFVPAEALKHLSHGRNTVGRIRVLLSGRKQDTDAPHPTGLLRARRERPSSCRAAEKRDELAPFHCALSPRACDRKDSTLVDAAGDCCNAGFLSGLRPLRV